MGYKKKNHTQKSKLNCTYSTFLSLGRKKTKTKRKNFFDHKYFYQRHVAFIIVSLWVISAGNMALFLLCSGFSQRVYRKLLWIKFVGENFHRSRSWKVLVCDCYPFSHLNVNKLQHPWWRQIAFVFHHFYCFIHAGYFFLLFLMRVVSFLRYYFITYLV